MQPRTAAWLLQYGLSTTECDAFGCFAELESKLAADRSQEKNSKCSVR